MTAATVLYIRCDSIGDAVVAAGMLRPLHEKFAAGGTGGGAGGRIVAVCQARVAPVYEACPFVDATIAFDRGRLTSDPSYQVDFLRRLHVAQPSVCLNTVYSREPVGDWIVS